MRVEIEALPVSTVAVAMDSGFRRNDGNLDRTAQFLSPE